VGLIMKVPPASVGLVGGKLDLRILWSVAICHRIERGGQ